MLPHRDLLHFPPSHGTAWDNIWEKFEAILFRSSWTEMQSAYCVIDLYGPIFYVMYVMFSFYAEDDSKSKHPEISIYYINVSIDCH